MWRKVLEKNKEPVRRLRVRNIRQRPKTPLTTRTCAQCWLQISMVWQYLGVHLEFAFMLGFPPSFRNTFRSNGVALCDAATSSSGSPPSLTGAILPDGLGFRVLQVRWGVMPTNWYVSGVHHSTATDQARLDEHEHDSRHHSEGHVPMQLLLLLDTSNSQMGRSLKLFLQSAWPRRRHSLADPRLALTCLQPAFSRVESAWVGYHGARGTCGLPQLVETMMGFHSGDVGRAGFFLGCVGTSVALDSCRCYTCWWLTFFTGLLSITLSWHWVPLSPLPVTPLHGRECSSVIMYDDFAPPHLVSILVAQA